MTAIVEESPGTVELVSLALAKSHLRVETSADDDLIKIYVQAARENFENDTARSFITKGYRMSIDAFPCRSLEYLAPVSDYGPIRYWNRLPNYSQAIKILRAPLVHISRISYLALDDGLWHDLFPVPLLWFAKTEYEIGDQVADANGNLQEVTAVTHTDQDESNSSGTTVPTWAMSGTTVDGDLTWTYRSVAPAGDFLYDKDSEFPRVFPLAGQIWPAVMRVPNAVVIHFTAGYGDAATAAPARALVAVLQIAGNYYQNRETVSSADLRKIPTQFDSLVWSLKVQDFAPTPG